MKKYGLNKFFHPIWLSNIGGNGIIYKGEIITLDKILSDAIKLARADEREKCIKELTEANPYPEDTFLPRTDEEMKKAANLIKKGGLSPDGIFGNFGRRIWQNAIDALKEDE